jgi:hypothetical protein
MNKGRLINDLLQGLLMAAVVAVALPMPELAFAQTSVGTSAGTITTTDLGPVTTLVAGLFYIGGGVLMGAGALKLKAHAEQPTQNPIGHGLGRLGAGAALMAIPYFGQTMINTLHLNTAATTFTGFGDNF